MLRYEQELESAEHGIFRSKLEAYHTTKPFNLLKQDNIWEKSVIGEQYTYYVKESVNRAKHIKVLISTTYLQPLLSQPNIFLLQLPK